MYQQRIREELARQGSIGTDPIQVEAWIRLAHSALDGLSAGDFAEEVRIGAECVASDPIASQEIAVSMGLVRKAVA